MSSKTRLITLLLDTLAPILPEVAAPALVQSYDDFLYQPLIIADAVQVMLDDARGREDWPEIDRIVPPAPIFSISAINRLTHPDNGEPATVELCGIASTLDRDNPAHRGADNPVWGQAWQQVAQLGAEPKWLIVFIAAHALTFDNPRFVVPVVFAQKSLLIRVNDDGRWLDNWEKVTILNIDRPAPPATSLNFAWNTEVGYAAGYAPLVVHTLAALNRGVPVREERPTRQQRRAAARSGQRDPVTRYHILDVDKRPRATYTESAKSGIRKAKHFVRGFFRRKPKGGMTFVRPHWRGGVEIGVVHKSYRVKPERE